MNLRVVGVPSTLPGARPTKLRVVDLDDPGHPMDSNDSVLGPDGHPLGHLDGTASAAGGPSQPTLTDTEEA